MPVENADSEYKPFQFRIADLLALMVIVAVLGATIKLPASFLHLILTFGVLYLVKFRILILDIRPSMALLLYSLLVAALLPYLYFCIFVPWEPNTDASPIALWVGGPIVIFTVPTAFFLFDVLAHRRRSGRYYTIRTLIEVCVLVPICAYLWIIIVLSSGWAAI
jgi:hypothetical protein